MLKFAKAAVYIPDPIRSRPNILAHEKEWAKQKPPMALPLHCKPWVDGQSVGWTLFYGFLTPITIVGMGERQIEVTNLPALIAETQFTSVVQPFQAGYFSFAPGYTLRTPPGYVSFIIPPVDPTPHLDLLPAIIETDWYPRQIFFQFRAPPAGVTIPLSYEQPLARVVVIPRFEDVEISPLSTDEVAAIAQEETDYRHNEAANDKWVDAHGNSFTHTYRHYAKEYRQALRSNDTPTQDA